MNTIILNQHGARCLQQVAVCVLLLMIGTVAISEAFATTATGTVINNQATARYTSGSTIYTVLSNAVQVVVQSQDNLLLISDQTITTQFGSAVNLPHTLINTGNTSIFCNLAVRNLTGYDFSLTTPTLYRDNNDNGVVDGGDSQVAANDLIALNPNQSIKLLIRGWTPSSISSASSLSRSAAGSGGLLAKLEISATTVSPSQYIKLINTDTISIGGSAVLVLTKTASTLTPAQGDIATFSLTTTNTGAIDAMPLTVNVVDAGTSKSFVLIYDSIPAQMSFVSADPTPEATPLYHLRGMATNSFQQGLPDTPSQVDMIAFGFTRFASGHSATVSFKAQVQPNASGSINNIFEATYNNPANSTPASAVSNSVTLIIQSPTPDLIITKQQTTPGSFTVGSQYSYRLIVQNIGAGATQGIVQVTDDLPSLLQFVANGSGGDNWQCSATGQRVTCSYSGGAIPAQIGNTPGEAQELKIVVNAIIVGNSTNVAVVSGGNEPASATGNNTSDPPVVVIVGPTAAVSGIAWLDANHDNVYQTNEPLLGGFTVQLLCDSNYVAYNQSIGGPVGGCNIPPASSPYATPSGTYIVIATTVTNSQGYYEITSVPPGNGYALWFMSPNTQQVVGTPVAGDEINSGAYINNGVLVGVILVADTVANISLPLDPSGIIYDSATRLPIAGAAVSLTGPSSFNAQTQTDGHTGSGNVATSVTGADGAYQFILTPDAPAGTYTLSVSANNYKFQSTIIPPSSTPLNHPRPTCNGQHCVQPQGSPPHGSESTLYYLAFNLAPGDADAVNNHIPLDPADTASTGTFTVEKTAARTEVELGDFLDYTLKITNHATTTALPDVRIHDRLPFGFVYVPSTARLNGAKLEHEPTSRTFPEFIIGTLPAKTTVTLTYRVRIGPGSMQGNGINSAWAQSGALSSNIAKVKVKITAGVFSEDGFIVGKVFLDCNRNRIQNRGEPGVPGVKLLLENGVSVTTDSEGKYSLYGLNPRTHVLRLDETTLPRGAKLLTVSSRNAGNPSSQFIDLSKGELHKANFAIKGCAKPLITEIKTRKKKLEAEANLDRDETERTLKNTLKADGTAQIVSDPRGLPASGAVGNANNVQTISHQGFTEVMPESEPVAPLASQTAPLPVIVAAHSPIEALLPNLDNKLGFVILKDHDTLPYTQTNVVLKGIAGGKLQLTINGEVISDKRVGKKMLLSSRQLEAWEYVGINLNPGDNDIIGTQIDPFGNIRDSVHITVKAPDHLGIIKLDVADTQYADGKTPVKVVVHLTDQAGIPVTVRTPLTLESELGRWQVEDLNPDEPGTQVFMDGGNGEYLLIPPSTPGQARLRVSSGILTAEKRITFIDPLRSMIAVGIVEGAIRFSNLDMKRLTPARKRDGFEDEITQFAFGDDGKTSGGARTSFYLKGKVRGKYLLTLAYDSEKKIKDRLFRDIQPDEYYPVYGDSSIRGFDAQSSSNLYVRVDRGRSYVLYGDFTTQSDSTARNLSQYNRSLTGLKHHFENNWLNANVFASLDSARQVIHEFPADGTSGPFFLPFANSMVLNTEQVEVLTRDRNQTSVIIKTDPKQRYVDYSIDSFTGRLLFTAPIASRDENMNPIFIRVTYEVDTGGAKFWIYGTDAQARVADWLELGGTAVKDENLENPSTITSVNSTIRLHKKTFVIGELANTKTLLSGNGQGERLEIRHESENLQARAYAGRTDANFDNPSASLTKGRVESAGKLNYQLAPRWKLIGEYLYTADNTTTGNRTGEMLSLEHTFKNNVRIETGVRHSQETLVAADSSTGRQVDSPVDSVRVKATAPIPNYPEAQVYSELEQDIHSGDRRMLALGGEYQFSNRGRFYARHEIISGISGSYALNTDSKYNRSTLVGLETDYMKDGQLFSEYRGESAFGGYEPEAAVGLRNKFTLSKGLLLNTSLERVQSLGSASTALNSPSPALNNSLTSASTSNTSTSNESTAITAAIEYTANHRWKGSARFEVRDGATSKSFLNTLGLAVKLTRDWTFLGRSAFAYTDNFQGDDTDQRRFQLGFAYRDTDEDFWHLLGRYEYRLDHSGSTLTTATSGTTTTTNLTNVTTSPSNRRVDILSFHANYQPNKHWVWSGRYALKRVLDRSNGIDSDGYGQLFGLRATVDVAKHWNVGVQSYLLLDSLASDQYGIGADVGYNVSEDLWFSVGYNLFGFKDKDFNDMGDTDKGIYIQLRYKFDERDLGSTAWWE